MNFVAAAGEFNVEDYKYACRVTITAQEILVDNASYPTPRIEENSHRYRPLGLGSANLGCMRMNRDAAYQIPKDGVPTDVLEASRRLFDEALELGREHGYRNAQISLLAPTATISFMMDCDTTGIEADI